jgi:hypothetical protein
VNVKKTKTESTNEKILGHGKNFWTNTGVKIREEIPIKYQIFSAQYVTQTDKAVLLQQGGLSKWIPKSQMCIWAGTEERPPAFCASIWILGKIGFYVV